MRVFNHPNTEGDWKCPVCGTDADSPVTLVPIAATGSGNTREAFQVHVGCLELEYIPEYSIIVMKLCDTSLQRKGEHR